MNFGELAEQRYSCRDMDKERPVEREKIEQILQAARVAPSACNLQRHRLKVIQSKEAVDKLRPFTPCHFNAPVVIVISLELDAGDKMPDAETAYKFGLLDLGIVVSQMALQAQELGLGSTIVGMFDAKGIQENFGIPKGQVPVLLLPIGYPGEKGGPCILHKQRRPLAETVEWL